MCSCLFMLVKARVLLTYCTNLCSPPHTAGEEKQKGSGGGGGGSSTAGKSASGGAAGGGKKNLFAMLEDG